MSNTITLTGPNLLIHSISINRNFEQRIHFVFNTILNNPDLFPNQQHYIQEWERQNGSYFRLVQTDQEIEKATQAIFDLLIDCIRPAFFSEANEVKQDAIFEIEMDLKTLLAQLLEKDLDQVDEEIESRESKLDEMMRLKNIPQIQFLEDSKNDSYARKIHFFVQGLLHSNLFTQQDCLRIEEWLQQSENYFQPAILNTNNGKSTASQVICFLLIDILRPAYLNENDRIKQLELVKFELQLKEILGQMLQRDPFFTDQYIHSIEVLCNEQKMMEEAINFIEEQEKKFARIIHQEALAVDSQLLVRMQELKTRLQTLILQERKDFQALVNRLDLLMDRVEKVMNSLRSQTPQLQEISRRLKEDNQKFNQIAQNITHLLEKV